MAPLNATKLRSNLYAVLDQVLETGQPVEILRRGRRLKIVPDSPARKTDALVAHPDTLADPESIVEMDWSSLWDPDHP